jgi:flagellar basal body-associated protein FliL
VTLTTIIIWLAVIVLAATTGAVVRHRSKTASVAAEARAAAYRQQRDAQEAEMKAQREKTARAMVDSVMEDYQHMRPKLDKAYLTFKGHL